MENGFESWFRDHRIGRETPDSAARKAGGPERPHGWFYGLPSYRQGFVPVPAAPKEPPPPPATAANGVQKKFLVFDRSGDRTTLIYTSAAGAPLPRYHPSPKPESPFDVKKVYPLMKQDRYESTEEEDTEELNALLYSSDETDSSENEETSTGHSPSTMTGSETRKRPPNPNGEEEAASCDEPGKRRKIGNGFYDVNPLELEDTASSGVNFSGGGEEQSTIEKRREEVKAAVARLRNLIPCGKNCDDALIVIDEAIRYLRDLKEKALVLGFNSD